MLKPKFLKGAVAVAACSLMFSACGDDSGSNAKDDSNDKVAVESSDSDDDASSSSKKEDKSSSSSKKDAESSDSEDVELIKEDFAISGVSQKGPFVSGTTVIGQELDGKTLKQTGRSFRGKINNDKGEFDIASVSLASQYVIIDATGYYLNEVTGSPSKSPITLNALVDLSDRNTVNVNLLTHLEYERISQLVSEGKSIADAKKQAQKEIFKAFGIEGVDINSEDLNIFGESDNSAALLTVSVLMQGDRSEGELTALLTDFANDLKKDGKWDNAEVKGQIAEWAMRMDLSGKLEDVRANVEGWKLGKVPNFEKNVSKYWKDFYAVGECNADKEGARVEIKDSENFFVCNSGDWKLAKLDGDALVYVKFDEPEESKKTIFDELDRSKVGVGNIWDYTHGPEVDWGSEDYTGFWYSFTDNLVDDGSSILLNSKMQYEQDLYQPSFLTEEGMEADKGVMYGFQLFNAGEREADLAYVGGGFNVMSPTETSYEMASMDVADWKGLCVVYSSTVPIEFRVRDTKSFSAYNQVVIPASTETRLLNLPWTSFKYPKWASAAGYDIVSIEDAVKEFSGISFLIHDEQDPENPITSGAIYIQAIGKLNGCSTK